MYRVFLAAPTLEDFDKGSDSYQWQTVSSVSRQGSTQSVILPPITLEAASRRISLLYQNIIFDDSLDDMEPQDEDRSNFSRLEGLMNFKILRVLAFDCKRRTDDLDYMASYSYREPN